MTALPGILALSFYVAHAAAHLLAHRPADLLWACHLACVWIGAGALFSMATPAAIGVSWLALGVPLWILDLATGGEFFPTSLLTHVGGAVVGVLVVRRLGVPRGTWWRATAALFVLHLVTRAVPSARAS